MARTRDIAQQEALLSGATWAVLAERGLTGLTVRAVAERAGCTTGLVFHTFESKQALLVHARKLLFERAAARVDEIEARCASPFEALTSVTRALLTLDRNGSEEARVWISFVAAALSEPRLVEHHLAGNRALLGRLVRLVRASRPDWEAQHAADFAAGLVALTEGFNVLSTLDPDKYPRRVQERVVLGALSELHV